MLSSPDKLYHFYVSLPALLWQLSENRTVFLRAFITDSISIAYVFESLFNTVLTYVMMWLCSVLPALRAQQHVQQRYDTRSAHFLRVNASSVLLFYGSAPWHHYLTQALPILTGFAPSTCMAPLAPMHGSRRKSLFFAAVWTSTVLSCAGPRNCVFCILLSVSYVTAWACIHNIKLISTYQ